MDSTKDIFTKNLKRAVKASTILVQEEARDNHNYISRTGALEKSTDIRFKDNGLVGEIFLNTKTAKYAPFVHEGSVPHIIKPKNKQALRWVNNGAFVFAKSVRHPGYKGDAFLYRALESKTDVISDIFVKYTANANKEVADAIRRRFNK